MKYALILFVLISEIAKADSIPKPLKISHAEPLFYDLVRDLGARKGERELNIGGSIGHSGNYVAHSGFAEFEFAPVNRLGFEVEVPFSFYTASDPAPAERMKNRIEGLKLATQYTFLVSGKRKMSMAAGYIHEFSTHSFETMSRKQLILKGHIYQPFFVIAKQWTPQFHSMLISTAEWKNELGTGISRAYRLNASMHYILPGPGHFIGMEINTETGRYTETIFRPQVRLVFSRNIALGIVTGIPARLRDDHLSLMFRLICQL